MKVLILAPFTTEALERLRQKVEVLYEPWTQTQRLWDPAELASRLRAENIAAVVSEIDFFFDEVFGPDSPLRFVGLCRQATNQVDLEAATAQGVVVVHTPGRNAQAVAELAIGLLLALARRIPQAEGYVRAGQWRNPLEAYQRFRGVELRGKTLGVVGLGTIGRRVARMGRALGMRVIATDPYAKPLRGVTLVSLEALLAEADFVSLHAPDTPATRHLLNAERLALMKTSAFLVNTGGGALVDTDALCQALQTGRLAGAALDVLEASPLPAESPLLACPNLVLTPHIGGATQETIARYSAMVTEDVQRWLAGKRPRHLANPAVWRSRR
ncbi:MAG: 3-phosphoglycerate dehydrogenase [Dehalococcoidia bacterium]|nr:3-phosphoglycerate dehydrogenase [Dehalococcoidia bacterium]MDW8120472.1 NAD(P)-dependent oxidoreductase [Chloroflexota bacterium]